MRIDTPSWTKKSIISPGEGGISRSNPEEQGCHKASVLSPLRICWAS